jgi:signal transduction histidine kinase
MSPATSSTPRRWLGLPPRIAVGLGLALASLVFAGAFSAFALRARTQSAELVSHATDSALALEEVESALLVAHASLDAYVGTRDPRHRQRHLRAWSKLEPALEELTRLVGQEPEEAARLSRLVPEIRTIKAEHAEALALADRGDFDAALALRRRNAGTSALERGKEAIEELELHETREVEARQLSEARTVAASNAGFLIAQGVLLVLVVLAARLVHDEIHAREANEAARARALDFQQRLMGVVSHDLRNPLTGILAAGWALTRAGLAEPEALLARRIVGAGRRMERLIRDLLDWSRVHGEAEIPISRCDADLHAVCRRIADELSDRQPGRIRVEHVGDTRGLFDPDRMEQVVANLVGNAVKYAPSDTPVLVRAVGEESQVRLEVRDEGPGIPPDATARLFEPFWRGKTDAVGDDGVGLGLFIVRTLVAAQGGSIEVVTAPGRGTTFVVRLPRGATGRPADPARAEAVG